MTKFLETDAAVVSKVAAHSINDTPCTKISLMVTELGSVQAFLDRMRPLYDGFFPVVACNDAVSHLKSAILNGHLVPFNAKLDGLEFEARLDEIRVAHGFNERNGHFTRYTVTLIKAQDDLDSVFAPLLAERETDQHGRRVRVPKAFSLSTGESTANA